MSGWHCIYNLHVYHSLAGVGTPRCMILFRNVTAPLTGKFERLIITPPINVITTSNIEDDTLWFAMAKALKIFDFPPWVFSKCSWSQRCNNDKKLFFYICQIFSQLSYFAVLMLCFWVLLIWAIEAQEGRCWYVCACHIGAGHTSYHTMQCWAHWQSHINAQNAAGHNTIC